MLNLILVFLKFCFGFVHFAFSFLRFSEWEMVSHVHEMPNTVANNLLHMKINKLRFSFCIRFDAVVMHNNNISGCVRYIAALKRTDQHCAIVTIQFNISNAIRSRILRVRIWTICENTKNTSVKRKIEENERKRERETDG